MNNPNPIAIITGATSGIGFEFVKILASAKFDLIVFGRNVEKLNFIKTNFEKEFIINIYPYSIDFSRSNEAISSLSGIIEPLNNIDILINCAGFGIYGEFYQTEFENEFEMINVNITILTFLTKLVLKKMIEKNKGKILNVSSTAAFKAGPLMAVYFATKAYVQSFSESIAAEIKHTNITVTILCPGTTKTQFMQRASLKEFHHFKYKKIMSPDIVALYGYKAMMKNKLIVIPGLFNKILLIIVKIFPRQFITNLMYILKTKKK